MKSVSLKKLMLITACVGTVSALYNTAALAASPNNTCHELSVSGNVPEAVTSSYSENSQTVIKKGYIINDMYKDIYSEEDIQAYFDSEVTALLATGESTPYFDNYEDVFYYVKDKMVARSTEFAFTVPMSISEVTIDGETWMIHDVIIEECMKQEHSTSCKDGDYLRSNYIGTEWTGAVSRDYTNNTVTFTIRNIYTATAEQEAKVDAMLPSVLASLNLNGKTQYEKIKAIHDYIAEHVTYVNDETYECHSTYAALIKGEAVCQGYASLFYRMCSEVGIGSRYICGYRYEPHGWNIVELNGKWYNVDVMKDDDITSVGTRNLLKSSNCDYFKELIRFGAYDNESFHAKYPMSQTDYSIITVKELDAENPDLILSAVDGTLFNTTAAGKTKILVFTDSTECTQTVIDDISSSLAGVNCDMYIVDYSCYDHVLNTYFSLAGMEDNGFYPYIVVINKNNRVVRAISGFCSGQEMKKIIDEVDRTTSSVPQPTKPSFMDVPANAWYADAVNWAVDHGITAGTSSTTFSPEVTCTRGQIVTFLWRAAGSPEPSSQYNPFRDITSGSYYYKAVLWAVEKGITAGTSSTTFSPEATCTRGQAVTFLHRYTGNPSVSAVSNPFGDVTGDAYYYNPVLWAVNEGVTSGTSTTTFSPDDTCTRGQIVTFLYRQAN